MAQVGLNQAQVDALTPETVWQQVGGNASLTAWRNTMANGYFTYPVDLALARYQTGKTVRHAVLVHYGDDDATVDLDAWFHRYNGRQIIEAGIKEGKNVFQMHHFKVRSPQTLLLQEHFACFAANSVRFAALWLTEQQSHSPPFDTGSVKKLFSIALLLAVALSAFAGPVLAGQVKVAVYHLDEEGNYIPISIADPAVDKHIAHGDELPGGGFLDANCEVPPSVEQAGCFQISSDWVLATGEVVQDISDGIGVFSSDQCVWDNENPPAVRPPYQLTGVDLVAIPGLNTSTVQTLISEIGPNVDAFPTVKHFCSWAGLAPHNDISGGKRLRSRTLKTNYRVGQAFRIAAQSVTRSPHCALGAFYRRMRIRLGAKQAIVASAQKITRTFYHLLKHRVPFHDLGGEEYERLAQERERKGRVPADDSYCHVDE